MALCTVVCSLHLTVQRDLWTVCAPVMFKFCCCFTWILSGSVSILILGLPLSHHISNPLSFFIYMSTRLFASKTGTKATPVTTSESSKNSTIISNPHTTSIQTCALEAPPVSSGSTRGLLHGENLTSSDNMKASLGKVETLSTCPDRTGTIRAGQPDRWEMHRFKMCVEGTCISTRKSAILFLHASRNTGQAQHNIQCSMHFSCLFSPSNIQIYICIGYIWQLLTVPPPPIHHSSS